MEHVIRDWGYQTSYNLNSKTLRRIEIYSATIEIYFPTIKKYFLIIKIILPQSKNISSQSKNFTPNRNSNQIFIKFSLDNLQQNSKNFSGLSSRYESVVGKRVLETAEYLYCISKTGSAGLETRPYLPRTLR